MDARTPAALALLALLAACGGKVNTQGSFDDLPPENHVRFSGLEGRPTPAPAPAGSAPQIRRFVEENIAANNAPAAGRTAGRTAGPPAERPANAPSRARSAPLRLPENVDVVLTVADEDSGTVRKVTTVSGLAQLDLSDVPDGNYVVTVDVKSGGFRSPAPQRITVEGGVFESFELSFERIRSDSFTYHWEGDDHGREFEYSANEVAAPVIEILGEQVETPRTTAAKTLREEHNIVLGDGDAPWSHGLASKLLKTVASIPHAKPSKPARFNLTERNLGNDIEFTTENGHAVATLSTAAFGHADSRLVKLDGRKGRFFSMRLFQAMVHFFTNNGADTAAVEKILGDKFGVTTKVPDHRRLTGESGHNFQRFHNDELVRIINAFSEMPEGYHKIKGLRYLVRRKDGHPHPLYPEAPAVAWPAGPNVDSYIEFMDTGFIGGSEDYVHRLILHEKAHFLWRNVFSDQLRADWIELGQWFENPEAASGWSTSDTTAFASPYAHAKNPNEDMAETLSYYVLNPNKLRSVASKKFDFVEQRIMNGYRYVSQIREDLTFEVLNLFPDYDYPGKIRRVEVVAEGGQDSDKRVTITIGLTDKDGVQDEASLALTRLFSPDGKTFKDLYLQPANGDGHRLQGTTTIPKHAKRGYWKIENITVTDTTGNKRLEGKIDFGFKLYINNRVEDTTPPRYVADSMRTTVEDGRQDGRNVFDVAVEWGVDEDTAMKSSHPVYANLISPDNPELYRISGYGAYNKQTRKARVNLRLTEFHPPGKYGVSFLSMQDSALNFGSQYFSDNPEHERIRTVTIDSSDPDRGKPMLDPERIFVRAAPLKPLAPDGSTKVNIVFYAKDDKSGLGIVHYKLVDPLGGVHFNYFYHSNFRTMFFKGGDPTAYKKYEIRTTLPKGSPPGRWGLLEIVMNDKVGNVATYNFLETVHFQILQ